MYMEQQHDDDIGAILWPEELSVRLGSHSQSVSTTW